MARPRCYLCFKQLMYVKGSPVYAVLKDENGEHKVHKDCLKQEKLEIDKEKSRWFREAAKL